MPAFSRININNGVFGEAVSSRKIQRVDDVYKFQGHMACDSSINSELVVPIIKEDKALGILYLNSIKYRRFTELEKNILKKFVQILVENMDWSMD